MKPAKCPINVSLTINERDAIDAAKGRASRLVALASAVMNTDEIAVILDDDAPVAELLDVIRESLQQIDATFAAADVRKATAGGAR